jgi:hypothetical protein
MTFALRTKSWMGSGALVSLVLAAGGGCGASPTAPEDLGESVAALTADDKTAFDFFLGKGLTAVQAAGIVGNLDVESGMDPTAVQSGGPGRGIAQWSAGARWDTTAGDNVKSYASMHGQNALSLGLQLDFIWFELQTFPAYGLGKLQAATTVTAAVTAFQTYYEGCGACSTSARVSDAQKALAAYGADVPSDGGASAADAGPTCVLDTGAAGVCVTTAACDALGNHVSTPGLCPGAADVQCCTEIANEAGTPVGDAGAGASGSGSSASPSTSAGPSSGDSGGGCNASGAGHGNGSLPYPNAALLALAGLICLRGPRRRVR